jgi:hypothetical protein
MSEMKNVFLVLLMTAVLVLVFSAPAPAVQFTYYSSGFLCESRAAIRYDAPLPGVDWNSQYAHSSVDVEGWGDEACGTGSGSWSNPPNYLEISLDAYADVRQSFYDPVLAYGSASTVNPEVTTGLFFRLDPTGSEKVGGAVRVSFKWSATAYSTLPDQASIYVYGPGSEYMALTLNDPPPTAVPDLSKAVWSRNMVYLYGNSSFEDSANGEFMAKIGDIISIYLGVAVALSPNTPSAGTAVAINRMQLQAAYISPTASSLPGILFLLLGN